MTDQAPLMPPSTPLAPPVTDGDREEATRRRPITEMPGVIPKHTMVEIFNPTDRPLVLKYENSRWVVPPEKWSPVPYGCAVIWFGDPRAKDDPKDRRMRMRTNELERVGAKWGLYADGDWGRIPQVKIRDLAGFELFFPALDPDGVKQHPNKLETEQLRRQEEFTDQQISALHEQVAALEAQNALLKNQRDSMEMDLSITQMTEEENGERYPFAPGTSGAVDPNQGPLVPGADPMQTTEGVLSDPNVPASSDLLLPDTPPTPPIPQDEAPTSGQTGETIFASPDDLDNILPDKPTPDEPPEPSSESSGDSTPSIRTLDES